jgi:hypothetical protein
MGKRDGGNSDDRTPTDGNKPQGGARGDEKTQGNPSDGKKQ